MGRADADSCQGVVSARLPYAPADEVRSTLRRDCRHRHTRKGSWLARRLNASGSTWKTRNTSAPEASTRTDLDERSPPRKPHHDRRPGRLPATEAETDLH